MDISLIKLLLLIAAFLRHGTPDSWDIALQARVSVYLPGPAITFSVGYDPVPIYYRALSQCGLFDGAIVVATDAADKGCSNTLQHETAHAWQLRTYGLILPTTYPAAPGLWEPERSWDGVPPLPQVLEFSLIRFWLPLGGP